MNPLLPRAATTRAHGRPSAARVLVLALLAAGCGNDIGITKQAACDGVLQQAEETVDQPFDVDGDGAFDAANPDCAATYAPQFLDCDESNPDVPGDAEIACNGIDDDCSPDTPDGEDLDGDGYDSCEDCADASVDVNPGAVEIACNAIDDDCDEATPDGADLDGDGWDECSDCDDTSNVANPGAAEVCGNGADDDCNGVVDDGCVSDYSDTWTLDDTISYSCAWGNVLIDFDRVLIDDAAPTIRIDALGRGIQPGEMSGTFTSATEFEAEQFLPGTCNETYTLTGSFTSMTSFEATFEARFSGSLCLDCANRSWTVTGSR